eukprot:2752147-Alexandrium_andersonii.AAC.1
MARRKTIGRDGNIGGSVDAHWCVAGVSVLQSSAFYWGLLLAVGRIELAIGRALLLARVPLE